MKALSHDERRLRRNKRSIVGDGIAFSVMVGSGEAYLPAFVLAAGLGDIASGLIATLPMLAGALVQLVTPFGVRRLRSHRRWVVLCAAIQAASLIPLAVGAASGRVGLGWVFLCATLYWGFGLATSPAWNTWVGSLIPANQRAPFFAQRTRWANLALLIAMLAAGIHLHEGGGTPGFGSTQAFALLFAGAALARLASAGFLARQSEPRALHRAQKTLPFATFLRRLRETSDGRLLAYLLAMQMAVNLAAPFFTPYMLGPLGLSYWEFTALTATALLARIVALPILGRLAQGLGTGRLLWAGAIGIVPLPSLWLVSPSFSYLVALQLFAGVAWATLEFSSLLSFFERIEGSERTSILTFFNLANAAAIACGSLLGAAIFREFSDLGGLFQTLFIVSSVARLGTLVLLKRAPALDVPPVQMSARTLAIRPSAGAIQGPILRSLPDAAAPEPLGGVDP